MADPKLSDFRWEQQPAAAELIDKLLRTIRSDSLPIDDLAMRMLEQTGTRLKDWVDSLFLGDSSLCTRPALREAGFVADKEEDIWKHPGGIFPAVVFAQPFFVQSNIADVVLAIKVDCVDEFSRVFADGKGDFRGDAGGPLRVAFLPESEGPRLAAIERHGNADFGWPEASSRQIAQAAKHLRSFEQRTRQFDSDVEGFELAGALVDAAEADLGVDWACDLFFESERSYWQGRNHAARVQYERQQTLGLGWGNHDHHTYRSSRAGFAPLIGVLEKLGFECRERFYAGEEAGWGAQVLEQSRAGLVVFADVDMSPEEVSGDFAHEGLTPRDDLGTVGLWCALHGESFLQAGMHHLECQFDFDAAREQLDLAGVETMAPFTDFSFLRQAFTAGENWQVAPERLQKVLASGAITEEQAEQFRNFGAVGSHLEILERNDGYKGFNQTGVSDIIARTDPRKV